MAHGRLKYRIFVGVVAEPVLPDPAETWLFESGDTVNFESGDIAILENN